VVLQRGELLVERSLGRVNRDIHEFEQLGL
jgi:hypothetical protein